MRWVVLVVGGALWLSSGQPGHAQTPAASSAPVASAEGAPSVKLPPDAELPKLLELPAIKPEPVDPVAAKELTHLLAKLTSPKADIRAAARKELAEVSPNAVGAIASRIEDIRQRIDRDRAPRLLGDVRKAARKDKKGKGAKDADDESQDDWLIFLHEQAKPEDETWRDLVELTSIVRMLGHIGTTPALREMIALRGKFGDLLRIDISRQIATLKDKAVPALIEARRNDAKVVARFAELELDRLGRAIPGEAVASPDADVLADVLRAFGYVRDVDAVGVCLSFANHDRRKVRDAARQAIAGIGEASRWQLRDTLQDLTGEKVDKSVPWDILARRIFHLYDQARSAELTALANSGLQAQAAERFEEAVASFDKVLARDPLYEGRAEMVNSYTSVALRLPDDRAEDKLALLRKARRLGHDEAKNKQIDAEIAVVEAKLLIRDGRPERFLLERALELDPNHAEAKELLRNFEQRAVAAKPAWPRKAVAGGGAAGGAAIAALILLVGRGRKKKPTTAAPRKDETDAVDDAVPPAERPRAEGES